MALRWALLEALRADRTINVIVQYTFSTAPTVEVARTAMNFEVATKTRQELRDAIQAACEAYGLYVANAVDRTEDLQAWLNTPRNIPGT